MYGMFTESARAVMIAANAEATRLKHQYIGSDDVLIGLAVGQADLATQAITSRVSVDQLRQKLSEMPRIEGPSGSRAKKVIEAAINESRALSHAHVGTEHLLLGLLRDTTSDASRVLIECGIDAEQLRSEILAQVPPGPSEQARQQQAIEQRFAEHPEVKEMKREIERLQRELEKAVLSRDFQRAAAFRDERRHVEHSLSELYGKLSEE
jgi:ATP-dependent Clp protease ATP-binding subunit ClpC